MQIFLLILIGAETFILIFLVIILTLRSRHFDFLIKELGSLAEDDRKLKKIDRERNDYLAMLVHELRSPLAVIRGSCDLILTEAQNLKKEQIEEILRQISLSSTSLLSDVNDILDVAKIESGRFKVIKVDGDLNSVLREVFNAYLPLGNKKGLTMDIELDESIRKVGFDLERMRQVLNNLISNAIKFTDPGDGIIVSSKRDGNFVLVEIADTGIGIPKEYKAKLFNKFVQVHDGIKGGGTGLGLYISKGIINAHEGSIWIEDNQPKGTRLVFKLPLV